jgi:hypothetical protein
VNTLALDSHDFEGINQIGFCHIVAHLVSVSVRGHLIIECQRNIR